MEKKYIIKLEENEIAYKTVDSKGTPMIQLLEPIPYFAPNIEQVREEAKEEGYRIGYDEGREAGVQCGLNDAWEAARKIIDCAIPYEALENYLEIGECTADVIKHLPASKAIEVVRQYEQEKEEQMQVGDEVEWMGDKYVVTYVRCKAKKADLISCKFGSACENVAFSALVKTGRHFPEIAEVLQKMRKSQ